MAEGAALRLDLGIGFSLLVGQPRRDSDNFIYADVALCNGHPIYSDSAELSTPAGRERWADYASGVDRPSTDELQAALLRMFPEILAALQERTRRAPADQIVDMLIDPASAVELWHDPDGNAWATFHAGEARNHWALSSKQFRQWLAGEYFQRFGRSPSTAAVEQAILVASSHAVHTGGEYPISARVGEHEGRIYLDLADDLRHVVEISTSGWQVLNEAPIRFRRSSGIRPLPIPERGGHVDELRRLIKLSDDNWILYVSCLAHALRPRGPYPVLLLHGEAGSGKSTAARAFGALIDPRAASLRAEPRSVRDVMIAATHAHVLAWDNLGRLQPWFSNAVCRLATGGGFGTRELWTNAEETLFEAQRPTVLNGIEEIATAGDLLSRAIVLELPMLQDADRMSEAQFWGDFDASRARILAGLLDAAAGAMARLATVEVTGSGRMADFVRFGTAAAPELGFLPDEFRDSYAANLLSANELALQSSLIAPAVCELVANTSEWSGTSTQLLHATSALTPQTTQKGSRWPRTGKGLSDELRRIQSNLRKVGVRVEFLPRTAHERLIRISLETSETAS
jgi:putative DNA primase/helicase